MSMKAKEGKSNIFEHEVICLGLRVLVGNKKGYEFYVPHLPEGDRICLFCPKPATKKLTTFGLYTLDGAEDLKQYYPKSFVFEGLGEHLLTESQRREAQAETLQAETHFMLQKVKRDEAKLASEAESKRIEMQSLAELREVYLRLTTKQRNSVKIAFLNFLDTGTWSGNT